ncbi:MAG: phosphoribulokinase [Gammaproteobacteria bacterium]
MVESPIVIGIVGDLAAGRKTLAKGVAQALGEHNTTIFCTDDYRRYDLQELERTGMSELHPDGLHIDVIEQHIRLLKQGEAVLKPVYNDATGKVDSQDYIKPKQFVIVEGLHGYFTKGLRDLYDIKFYLAPAEELRFKWKIRSDAVKPGYNEEKARKALIKFEPDSEAFIRPQKKWADMVIVYHKLAKSAVESDSNLGISMILRPTLSHIEWAGILSSLPDHDDIRLELDRDMGLPVDRLEINGDITDEAALSLKSHIQGALPETIDSESLDKLGWFHDLSGEEKQSQTFALAQLIAALHILNIDKSDHA